MRPAADVARYILQERGPTNTYALQKLLYYAQCWCVVELGHGCFDEPMEGWRNGPVVRSVWKLGNRAGVIRDMPGDASRLSAEEQRVVDAVIAFYGDRGENELIEATHAEPGWLQARKGLKPGDRGEEPIDPGVVARYLVAVASGRTLRERMSSAWDATRFRSEARKVLEPHRDTMIKLAMS